LFASLVTGK